jgi:hypothetical protein
LNLTKYNIIDKQKTIDLILQLENTVIQYVDEDNKTNEIEEITENIFIFTTMSYKLLKADVGWEDVIENIHTLSQIKTKEHKSMSSRAVFKYMDILDYLKKNKEQ